MPVYWTWIEAQRMMQSEINENSRGGRPKPEKKAAPERNGAISAASLIASTAVEHRF